MVKKDRETQIFTFLSVLDRHFMIAPVDCTIKNIEFEGKLSDAERLGVTFEDTNGEKFVLDQIGFNIRVWFVAYKINLW